MVILLFFFLAPLTSAEYSRYERSHKNSGRLLDLNTVRADNLPITMVGVDSQLKPGFTPYFAISFTLKDVSSAVLVPNIPAPVFSFTQIHPKASDGSTGDVGVYVYIEKQSDNAYAVLIDYCDLTKLINNCNRIPLSYSTQVAYTFLAFDSKYSATQNYDFANLVSYNSDFTQTSLGRASFAVGHSSSYWKTLQINSLSDFNDVQNIGSSSLNLDANSEILISFPTTDGSSFLGMKHVLFNQDALQVESGFIKQVRLLLPSTPQRGHLIATHSNSFSVVQDSNLSEMEFGTVAVLFNPFPPTQFQGTIFKTSEYWFGVVGSGWDSMGYLDLWRNYEFMEYENIPYYQWKLAVLTIQNSGELDELVQLGLLSQVFNLPSSIKASQIEFGEQLNLRGWIASIVLTNNPSNLVQYFTCPSDCASHCYYDSQETVCLSQCQSNEYLDSNSNCKQCEPECDQCYSSKHICLDCSHSSLTHQSNGRCQCMNQNFQFVGSSGSCELVCHAECAGCTGPTAFDCQLCKNVSYKGECISACPAGTVVISPESRCEDCSERCAVCSQPHDFNACSSCNAFYQFDGSSTCKLVCSSNFEYYDMGTGNCEACHHSCGSCEQTSTYCTSCPEAKIFHTNQCLSCSEYSVGLTDSPYGTGCIEICGDGLDFGKLECDDGNLLDDDGCNSTCEVEYGFECSGGTESQPDVCVDVLGPQIDEVRVSASNAVNVTFTESIFVLDGKSCQVTEDTLILGEDYNVSISGGNGPYGFKAQAQVSSSNSVSISLEMLSSLEGGESVTIEFKDGLVADSNGNELKSRSGEGTLQPFTYLSQAQIQQAQAVGSSSAGATYFSILLNIGISMAIKSSMKQMWNLLNMMQLITYISLLSVPVPPNVVMVVEYFRFSRGEIPFVQNLIQTQVLAGSDLHDGGINEAFAQEYDSTSVIYNSGGVIFMWGAVWLGLGVLLLLMRCLGRRVLKICKTVKAKFFWNGILRLYIQSYLTICFCVMLNLFYLENFSHFAWLASNLICLLLFVVLLMGASIALNIMNVPSETLHSKEYIQKYGTIYDNLKYDEEHPFSPIYYPVFFVRRFLFSLVFILFVQWPAIQLSSIHIINFLNFLYLLLFVTHKDTISSFLSLFSDMMLLITYLTVTFFYMEHYFSRDTLKMFGWVVVVEIGIAILFNILLFVPQQLVRLCSTLRKKCSKKSKKRLQPHLPETSSLETSNLEDLHNAPSRFPSMSGPQNDTSFAELRARPKGFIGEQLGFWKPQRS